MKIVLAFDSFKGSLTAEQAVQTARAAIFSVIPDAVVVPLPLADGGEGTTEALCHYTQATPVACTAHNPLHRPISAYYAISNDGQTAIMEMAAAAGLTLLAEHERNPMLTSTYGAGEVLVDAISRGCRHILIGIGGSATCDGGMGFLSALGARFLDNIGQPLAPNGSSLGRIAHIDWSGLLPLDGIKIDTVCDVSNPLFGPNGAACVYAPQKGANSEEVCMLDNGLRHFAAKCQSSNPPYSAKPDIPGSGAAGGLGYALLLLGATLRRGVDVVLDAAHIDSHLCTADLCLTGEGRIDRQTLNGKLPYGVLQRATAHGVSVTALAGQADDLPLLLRAGFHTVVSITPAGQPLAEAMRPAIAQHNLSAAVTKLMNS